MSYSLFDVLSMDERIIVYSSEEDQCFYTWNQADTLQRWQEASTYEASHLNKGGEAGQWEECGVMTKSGHGPKDYKEAREAAVAWHVDA